MKICDECKKKLTYIAITCTGGYGSTTFDGETFEFCSDECFVKWVKTKSSNYRQMT